MKKIKFRGYLCDIIFELYADGQQVAISLMDSKDGEPVAIATTRVRGIDLKPDETLIKDYSENEGILKVLVENEIVIPTDKYVDSGWVRIPICKVVKCNLYTVDVTWKYTRTKEFKTQRYFFYSADDFSKWLNSQTNEAVRKIIRFQTYAEGIKENDSKSSKDFQ